MSVHQVAAAVLIGFGTFLIAVAVLGLIRLPDAYCRINAVAKAASLGVVCVLLGVLVWMPGFRTALAVLPALALQLFTAPLSGYATGRAAHRSRAPLTALTSVRLTLASPVTSWESCQSAVAERLVSASPMPLRNCAAGASRM
jgi:multicomponent Na+:H+ antiporter subunit G